MRSEESLAIRQMLGGLSTPDTDPVIDIGSGMSGELKANGWIAENLYARIEARGVRIVRVDLGHDASADIVANILDEDGRASILELSPKTIFCFNTLEHVTDLREFCGALLSLCPMGGYICLSVPYRYSYHDAPIDSGFRPKLDELTALFHPRCRLVEGRTMEAGRYLRDVLQSPRRAVGLISRFPVPLRGTKAWAVGRDNLAHLFRPFEVTIALLQRTQ